MRPKRSLGQNFLHDAACAAAVVREGALGEGTAVVEVGPGRGFLTRHLLAAGARVTVVEKDDEMAASLEQWAGEEPGLSVMHADFLELDLMRFAAQRPVLVGNLPYNVSLPMLRRALERGAIWPRMVFMFQLEVAQRICAGAGTKDYGMPTVVTALTHAARIVRRVPPGAFHPRPQVTSALVRFEPLPEPVLPVAAREPFLAWLSAGLRMRRKTAVNALAGAGDDAARVRQALWELGLAESERLERLGLDRLVALWYLLRGELVKGA
jgi:16S rRNA (adenine1518-N6/adenine1519-N6)-dimethyltransferase